MKIRRQFWRLAILAALVALGWAVFTHLDFWRTTATPLQAQQAIARGRLDEARRRLASLASRPGTKGSAADYWLEQKMAGFLVRTAYVVHLSIPGISIVTAAEFAGEMGRSPTAPTIKQSPAGPASTPRDTRATRSTVAMVPW